MPEHKCSKVQEAQHTSTETDPSEHKVDAVKLLVLQDELDGPQVEGIDGVDYDEAPLEPNLRKEKIPEGSKEAESYLEKALPRLKPSMMLASDSELVLYLRQRLA